MTRAVTVLLRSWLLCLPLLGGCGVIPLYSYNNGEAGPGDGDPRAFDFPRPVENLYRTVSLRPLRPETITPGTRKASLRTVPWYVAPACRTAAFSGSVTPPSGPCHDANFVALSISGGGSRAAIFGAAVMFELERYGLLDDVDLLSCVSGGCLTAGYYALSCDDRADASACPPTTNGAQRYLWRESEVYPLLERRLLWRWFGNWFWPDNILKFWFTHFDRTDIMAETLSNNLYDRSVLDNNQFRFRDLNPARPNLAINATRVVADAGGHYHFAFAPETFAEARSDLDRYPIANAVMASAAFPGAFNYVTLRDFRAGNYIHLLDGGAYDNLGLNAIRTAMEAKDNRGPGGAPPANRVVIIIDAYMALDNNPSRHAEVRSWTDYVVDRNFFAAYDMLLTSLRAAQLGLAETLLHENDGTLLHISWENLDKDPDPEIAWLGNRLNRIPTSFNITGGNADRLRQAARIVVARTLTKALCDPGRPDDARRIRALLSPSAPPVTCP